MRYNYMFLKVGNKYTILINSIFIFNIYRLGGRMVHASSGRSYHVKYNPPKAPGIDDVTIIIIRILEVNFICILLIFRLLENL